jgi:thiol-disulfide isomerase/thioredoxin
LLLALAPAAAALAAAPGATNLLTHGVPALVGPAGASARLDVYRGRVVLLNFWATWCGPCREEMPDLDRLDATLDHQKAAVVGIAANEPAEVRAFLSRLKVGYPIVVGAPDPVLAWSATLGNDSLGLPFSVLVDGKGQLRWVKSGGKLTFAEAQAQFQKLLAPPRS